MFDKLTIFIIIIKFLYKVMVVVIISYLAFYNELG